MKTCDFRLVVALGMLLASLAGGAHGQYVWLDEQGRKQYSDLPPPPSVPESRILKQPGSAPASAPAPTPAGGQQKTESAPPSLAEREAEFRKRRAEKAEQEKKAAEEARVTAENKKRCERLREYQQALESGERLARRDKNGERQFMSDEERARELRDAKRTLTDCK